MERVTSILNRKQRHLHTVSPDAYVTNALQQMRSENVDYLVVINEEERFVGLLTDSDVATRVVFGRGPLTNIRVRDVMNTHLPVVTVSDTVEQCMRAMRQYTVRFLPVFDGFDFQGIVSSDDILNEVVENRMLIFDPEEDQSYVFA
jgi:CBS domain-containing protein